MPEAGTQEGFERVNCLLCGTDNTEALVSRGQHGLPAHAVLCKTCGLGYLNPRWTKSRYINFYTNEYDGYYRTYLVQKKDKPVKSTSKSPVKVVMFERLKKNGIMPSSIRSFLDIGSGSGGFIRQAKSSFPDAAYFAIEPSANCRTSLENMGVSLIAEDVDNNWEQKHAGKFDFVHMRHVLEHFSDPVSVLKKVNRVLTDDGLVYIAVPNSMNPALPLCSFFFRVVHTYYFNAATLTETAVRAGLEPLAVIDGDEYNRHEVVAVFRRGNSHPAFVNSYARQSAVFRRYISHEMSLLYRFRQFIRKIMGTAQVDSGD